MHNTQDFRILICGVGSAGGRHLQNLESLGHKNIILYRSNNHNTKHHVGDYPTYNELDDALACKPDIAIISNPTHLHLSTSITCAEADCHLLIEKPLSHKIERTDTLKQIADDLNLKILVGYMLRFHPCLMRAKDWIDSGHIGNVIYARSTWGEYLPDWHPWEDYRDSYAGRKSMGGGPALTLSHDLDIMNWFLGNPVKVQAIGNSHSDLQIDTDHAIDILAQHEGSTSNIHLDYFQKPSVRYYEFVGQEGKITFDYYSNITRLYKFNHADIQEDVFTLENFSRNDMFIEELKHLFKCIKYDNQPKIGLDKALATVDYAKDAMRAAQNNL